MWVFHIGIISCIFIQFLAILCESELISDEQQAWEFLLTRDKDLINYCKYGNSSDQSLTIDSFAWHDFTNPLLKRAFNLTERREKLLQAYDRESQLQDGKRLDWMWAEMPKLFFASGACMYQEDDERKSSENDCTMMSRTEILEEFYKVGNEKERKYYWVAWRDAIRNIGSLFVERMQLVEKLKIRPNYVTTWVGGYEKSPEWIAQDMERVWGDVFPLFKEMHAYVRRRLVNFYGANVMKSNSPIPSHLIGMTTNHWWAIKDIVMPYPKRDLNITEVMQKKNITNIDVVKMSEDFFRSLGLPYMDKNIWENSKFVDNRHCKSRVQFNCEGKIDAMALCAPVNELYLHSIIGSITYIYVINQEHQPAWPQILTFPPNPAFVNGLRYTVELPTWAQGYLSEIGLVTEKPMNHGQVQEEDINHLMKAALRYLTEMSYVYTAENWMWDSLSSVNHDDEYNKKWWQYSLKYQGVCPPVRRTEKDFDPVSSRNIAMNVPSNRDFMGNVYSFQFYKASCKEAGHTDLLHRCNLYGATRFGDKIRRIVSLGQSMPWQEGMSIMTDGESSGMDAGPLLEYFQPLYEWLRKENEGKTVGWESNDPMVCP